MIADGLYPGPEVDGRPTWLTPAPSPLGWEWRGHERDDFEPSACDPGAACEGEWVQCRPPDPEPVTVTIPRDVARSFSEAFPPLHDGLDHWARLVSTACRAALAEDAP